MNASRLAVAAVVVLSASASAQSTFRVSTSAGYATAGLEQGAGPSVGLEYVRALGSGSLVAAVRLSATAEDRAGLASGYVLNSLSATCTEPDSDDLVDSYLCNPFQSSNSFLGAYSAELAYSPGIPVAFGVGVRFAEEISERDGKHTVTRPYATALVHVPLTDAFGIQARARGGVDLAEAHVGLALSF